MDEGKIIVGLDIGTTKVACIVGRQTEQGKIEILGYGKTLSTGVRRGVVTNIIETTEAIKVAVKEAEDRAEVNIKRVSVGIAGQHIKSLQHRGLLLRDNHETEITEVELENLRNETFKINFIKVDFPPPLGPIMATKSFSSISRFTSVRTGVLP